MVELQGFSWEQREVMLKRLHRAFAASGCWVVEYKRCGRRAVEYSFEVGLGAVVELYCGLLHAGLEMTDVSHRAMTELCVLRRHESALGGAQRAVSLRLTMNFLEVVDETEVIVTTAASA